LTNDSSDIPSFFLEVKGKMAGILNILTGNANVAAEAQCLKSGGLFVQLLPETKQVVFGVEGDKKVQPVVIDLKSGLILNAQFPPAQEEEVVL
jgi:hypothetical protein